ncbi:hypothetical protein CDAR_3931 [Caerostris darwini]|uniref:Secreted protein n=1 Tax=Caerostris darwini TaxID=1538125 RepID=A0AAV4T5R1_9ARAC|nr:hypothetical protein CDAR_3931 [Caerostris darwini]
MRPIALLGVGITFIHPFSYCTHNSEYRKTHSKSRIKKCTTYPVLLQDRVAPVGGEVELLQDDEALENDAHEGVEQQGGEQVLVHRDAVHLQLPARKEQKSFIK